jgi:hypothetical protein
VFGMGDHKGNPNKGIMMVCGMVVDSVLRVGQYT